MRNLLAVVVTCLALSACSSMLLGNSSAGGPGLGTDTRSQAEMSEDNAITATIRSRYNLDTGISGHKINVTTYLRTVTLTGTVDSFAERDRAVQIARNTDNVRSVDNQILVNTAR